MPTPLSHSTMPSAFTDIFIKRPVLSIVVTLVIVIAGLQAIKDAHRPPVPGKRERLHQPSARSTSEPMRNWFAAFITTPLEKAIATADGID